MTDQFLGKIRLEITTGEHKSTWEYSSFGTLMINFTSSFSDDSEPSSTTVDIFNLSQDSQNFIQKGSYVVLSAGYQDDIGVISEGTINYVYPRTSDGNGEIKSSFTFLEGEDYSKKEINLSLSNGISAQDVITRVSQAAGIPISEINLQKEKSYSDGYSVEGSAMDALTEVAEDAGSKLFYKRGRIIINAVTNSSDNALVYDAQHGLIGFPQPLDWSSDDDIAGYSVELLLNHRITVGQGIKLNSRYGGGGIYHFRNGEHSFDGTSFRTTGEII
ncbi:hypothetical protein ESZ50_04680 [Weissella muntiaci]|uniref:Uncharacterized protein n=1 Tax=Weissella muntiaci TaxID=2508881 RepID=A0A6C2C7C4_9LACO|nr:hypothetical protein [Weissella muntiaci]TYC49890.1 hypothetical protein ESZ50_04680 [Weissella muntiaci]